MPKPYMPKPYTPMSDLIDMTASDAPRRLLELNHAIFGGYTMEDDSGDGEPEGETPEGDDSDDEDQGPGDDAPVLNEHGFPDNTPIKDMSTEQELAYWKHKARKHESRSQRRVLNPEVQQQIDALAGQLEAANGRAATSEVRGALRARGFNDERIGAIVGALNPQYFLTDQGEVDTARVSEYAGSFPAGTRRPDTGQGNRGETTGGKESGSELYDRLYGKK